uniref:Fungal lipase-type domain-containing protein n=1 Tax=Nelumbo nucifera TaxID=4432 RepID=A0A822YZ24_NELNU|nr:TPA_asm: hypothetical protein HUJ06_007116 [Nelumbo nucifera]
MTYLESRVLQLILMTDYQRKVMACCTMGVYVLERDRQNNRQGPQALAEPWWKSFHFELHTVIKDTDGNIFGVILEFNPQTNHKQYSRQGAPRYVIAFRGTIPQSDSLIRDLKLDFNIIMNELHLSPCFHIAVRWVEQMVATKEIIWLTGHSLGASMAMLAGKKMAKNHATYLPAFLFNPPFPSFPTEMIKDKTLKNKARKVKSILKALLAKMVKPEPESPFAALFPWMPHLFVNPEDHICMEYKGYFEHRKVMEECGMKKIEQQATQYTVGGLMRSAIGNGAEPLHLIPSANLFVNLSPVEKPHAIKQWWMPNMQLQRTEYRYK